MTPIFEKRPSYYADVTPSQWNDWHWQQRHRIRSMEELERIVELSDAERAGLRQSSGEFRMAITPYYASLIQGSDPEGPIRRQAIPVRQETDVQPFELEDPLGEEEHMPVPGVTHRYPDRVLFYVTHNCPVYCRHCTRKRKVSDPESAAARSQIERGLEYIEQHEGVRDVLLSGGDPLTLGDERLRTILERLRAVDHLEVIRVGTRNPVTLPQRITPEFCTMLREFRPIYLNTHFNHPRELTQPAADALGRLLDAGCVLGNQMVLLRGVNDDPETVMRLNRRLLEVGCRPYYMLQCDMARGITHFRTALRRGLEIMDHLRGRIAGMGVPDFVVDLPGGGGKIELVPDYLEGREEGEAWDRVEFRNWSGETYTFADLVDRLEEGSDEEGRGSCPH